MKLDRDRIPKRWLTSSFKRPFYMERKRTVLRWLIALDDARRILRQFEAYAAMVPSSLCIPVFGSFDEGSPRGTAMLNSSFCQRLVT